MSIFYGYLAIYQGVLFFGGGRSVGTWCRQEWLDSDSYRSYSYSQHGSLLDLSGFASYLRTIVTPGKEHQSQDSEEI